MSRPLDLIKINMLIKIIKMNVNWVNKIRSCLSSVIISINNFTITFKKRRIKKSLNFSEIMKKKPTESKWY